MTKKKTLLLLHQSFIEGVIMPSNCSFLREDTQAFLVEVDIKAFLVEEGIQVKVQILKEQTTIAKKEEELIIITTTNLVGIKAGNFTDQKDKTQVVSCILILPYCC
jgi:hypothetical protein